MQEKVLCKLQCIFFRRRHDNNLTPN